MIWPQLKVGENEYKKLHECNRAETIRLHETLTERYVTLMGMPGYESAKRQMRAWLGMTENRIYQFDNAMIVDTEAEKPQKVRHRLLDD